MCLHMELRRPFCVASWWKVKAPCMCSTEEAPRPLLVLLDLKQMWQLLSPRGDLTYR